MLGKLIALAAPFVITTARIVATDPAMRNFIIEAKAELERRDESGEEK